MRVSTYQKWRMPKALIEYLLSAIDFKGKNFISREDYAVRNSFVKLIEENFQKKAEVDCFATKKNSQCISFFTKDEDALQKEWGRGMTVWLNPPWSLWPKVAKKFQTISCDAICIIPCWRRGWVRHLLRRVTKKMYFQTGTKFFNWMANQCVV